MLNDEVRQFRAQYVNRGHGHLFHNLLLFCRILREMGLDVNPTRTIDLLRSLEFINLKNKQDFYEVGKAIMLRHNDEQPIYDYVFQMFWRKWPTKEELENPLNDLPPEYWGDKKEPGQLPKNPNPEREDANKNKEGQEIDQGKMSRKVSEDEADENAPEDEQLLDREQTYSASEILQSKDFQDFSQEELQEAKRLLSELRWKLSLRVCRRYAPSRNGNRFDGRRTVRKALRFGGVPLELARKERKQKPRQLVLICDVSGSMDLYSRLLLQFMHSLENGLRYVETFVFGTRLTRITHELRNKNVDEALLNVSKVVKDWAGGTKIGESLETFNVHWARRVLGHGAIVIIISDGWDRGGVDILRREMARLQRLSYRLIWLNPLLGLPDYQPLTVGIQAALDYVDDFLPAHNFKSMRELGMLLESLSTAQRPERKQHFAKPLMAKR
ncbi:MAG: VWA domain-containing protein [Chloroflexi bacterium]|uniref:VWA domain-containing protein n=1 Tax=Candidatus Chlorohelix allophototropha TaxID=3003348 RepID=A0A8T7LWI6_9CHLR|nr:VWA domain-containing protein [Chloroflexota bacterium]WJW65695.1 VWA domain-containing protein [Chloroflexota bacterium L227-S17]